MCNTTRIMIGFEPDEHGVAYRMQKRDEVEIEDDLSLYPNPAHDYLTLEYNLTEQYAHLSYIIQDASGKILLQQILQANNGDALINISDLSGGIYSFILYGDGKLIEIKKITIVK